MGGTKTRSGYRGGWSSIAAILIAAIVTTTSWHGAQAYTFRVLYYFCSIGNCADGALPAATLVLDKAGNLYGTTLLGGYNQNEDTSGTVFKLSGSPKGTGLWNWSALRKFCENSACPAGASPALDPLTYAGAGSGAPYDGNSALYGTTNIYGPASCKSCGTGNVYRLTPTANHNAAWFSETVHKFPELTSGGPGPYATPGVVMDKSGNLFGVRGYANAIYELTPPPAGQSTWAFNLIHYFCAKPKCADGKLPGSAPIIDKAGNLYGVTREGGSASSAGTVWELSPPAAKGGKWTYSLLYTFCAQGAVCSDGGDALGSLVMDGKGNLYGTTTSGGAPGGNNVPSGTVFKMTPPVKAGGQWTHTVLYNFANGGIPYAALIIDGSGNLFGTTLTGGGNGSVFELSPPTATGGKWVYSLLYGFPGTDYPHSPAQPVGGLVMDSAGNLFGTTESGGHVVQKNLDAGVAFELVK